MTIFAGSRYEYSDVESIAGSDGIARDTIVPSENNSETTFSFSWYTTKDGDRIDIIAEAFLGDAQLWWQIADYNPQWMYWDYLPPGTLVRIPNGLTQQG